MSTEHVKVERDEKAWEIRIEAEITAAAMAKYKGDVLKELAKTAKIDGFRPGKAPESRIVEMYGEDMVLRRAAEHAIQHEIPEILAKEGAMIIEAPRVTTDTPQADQPLRFTAVASMAPRVELPDYQVLAKKHQENKETVEVTDKEHDEALAHIRRERARIEKMEAGGDAAAIAEEIKAIAEGDLPIIDDTFVQSLGYENAEKFSEALRANILNEKQLQAQQKRRGAILDELIKDSKISYPAALRSYELDDMETRLRGDVSRAGIDFEKYLADTKKTIAEIRKEWEPAAESRVKVRLILTEIARKEHLDPSPEVIDHELSHALAHYPKASVDTLRANITHALRNEMAIRFLEGDTTPVGHTAHDH